MTSIVRDIEWCAGHRVLGHEGKCKNLHGHTYKAEVEVTAKNVGVGQEWDGSPIPDSGLDGIGRVVDFSVVKGLVQGWVDENWDHNFLCHPSDPLVDAFLNSAAMLAHSKKIRLGDLFSGRAPHAMTYGNPTAENIARELHDVASRLLGEKGLVVVSVVVWETPRCRAVYRPL
jgi:6-pyruvoyltetrahydropterin/6-carboxytetrahydropterin synthase